VVDIGILAIVSHLDGPVDVPRNRELDALAAAGRHDLVNRPFLEGFGNVSRYRRFFRWWLRFTDLPLQRLQLPLLLLNDIAQPVDFLPGTLEQLLGLRLELLQHFPLRIQLLLLGFQLILLQFNRAQQLLLFPGLLGLGPQRKGSQADDANDKG
jgi:hypothetical protein